MSRAVETSAAAAGSDSLTMMNHSVADAAEEKRVKEQVEWIERNFTINQQDDWEYAPLFDELGRQCESGEYEWSVLLRLSPLLLGEMDSDTGTDGDNDTEGKNQPESSQVQRHDTAHRKEQHGSGEGEGEGEGEVEDEDDGEDEDEPGSSTSPPHAEQQPSLLNDSDLGMNQARAFRHLHYAIVRHLASPSSSSDSDATQSSSDSSSSSFPSKRSTPTPVILPRNGDIIGLWLLALLSASSSRRTALCLLHSLELLGSLCALRTTIRKMFLLLQREKGANNEEEEERMEQERNSKQGTMVQRGLEARRQRSKDTDDDDGQKLAGSSFAHLLSPHLPLSGPLTPSSLLPLPMLTPSTITRLNIRPQLLRTLQSIVGDGLILPSGDEAFSAVCVSDDASLLSDKQQQLQQPQQPATVPIVSPSSSITRSQPVPSVYYSFTETTPIFPRVSGGSSPGPNGYGWSAWIWIAADKTQQPTTTNEAASTTSMAQSNDQTTSSSSSAPTSPPSATSPSSSPSSTTSSPSSSAGGSILRHPNTCQNLFRFFNDLGYGVQVFLRNDDGNAATETQSQSQSSDQKETQAKDPASNKPIGNESTNGVQLGARVLPHANEGVLLRSPALERERWHFITIIHKPRPQQPTSSKAHHHNPYLPTTTTFHHSASTSATPATSNMANASAFYSSKSYSGMHRLGSNASSATMTPGSGSGIVSPTGGGRDPSPSSPGALPRPAQMFLYIDGLLVSSNEVPYPAGIEASDSLQLSLGGYIGRMAHFNFFHDVLTPSAIYSLYTLGAGAYAQPAHHLVSTGVVAIFSTPAAATSLYNAEHQQSSGSKTGSSSTSPSSSSSDSHSTSPLAPTPPLLTHRLIGRTLLSHSPIHATHEFCLPSSWTWTEEWQPMDGGSNNMRRRSSSGGDASCSLHAVRLPGVDVVHRRHNSQTFADLGGLKLLLHALSSAPGQPFVGTPASMLTDEDVAETLSLIAVVAHANTFIANQLLEIGAIPLKQLLLEPLRRRHKTPLLLRAIQKLLLVVAQLDSSGDKQHFSSFFGCMVLDWVFWRGVTSPSTLSTSTTTTMQRRIVDVYAWWIEKMPRPFLDGVGIGPGPGPATSAASSGGGRNSGNVNTGNVNATSIGVARCIDSIRVILHRFFTQDGYAAQSGGGGSGGGGAPGGPGFGHTLTVPSHAHMDLLSPASGILSPQLSPISPAPTPASASTTASFPSSGAASASASANSPWEEEMSIIRGLFACSLELARQMLLLPHAASQFDNHVLHPYLHLLQLATASASNNFPSSLLVEFLRALLQLIALSPQRIVSFLYSTRQVHIFLRLLFLDCAEVRTLALRVVQHLNAHAVRIQKSERSNRSSIGGLGGGGSGSAAVAESIHFQSDIASAIGSCLVLHLPISTQELDALFEMMMGQPPSLEDIVGSEDGAAMASSSRMRVSRAPSLSPTRTRPHRGLSLEAPLSFSHSAFLSALLEVAIASPLSIQAKMLMDLLTLLRSSAYNVRVMASLFWQRMILPYHSALRIPQASHKEEHEQHTEKAPEEQRTSGEQSTEDGSTLTPRDGNTDRATIDALVSQMLNLLLVHCMNNEKKGWQVLDQVLWCIDEAMNKKEMAAMSNQSLVQEDDDVSMTTTSNHEGSTVSEKWKLIISIINRLFQVLSKSIPYLSSSSKSNDPCALHSEEQQANLRTNIPAVCELLEWVLFHSPESFLSQHINQLRRRTSSVSDRDSGTDSQAPTPAAVSRQISAQSASEAAAAAAASSEADQSSLTVSSQVAEGNNAKSHPAGGSPNRSRAESSASPTAAAASMHTISRASFRGMDEPLSESEVEALASLLTGVVKGYPLPERRQDVLRIMFRYLMAVLPHPLCVPLCPLICECTMFLFTERITERNEKNNRLIALSLHLLKGSMELFLRRDESTNANQVKEVMAAIYSRYGPEVFQHPSSSSQDTPPTPRTPQAASRGVSGGSSGSSAPNLARTLSGADRSTLSRASSRAEPAQIDLLTGAPPVESSSSDVTETIAEESAGDEPPATAPSAPEAQESPLEQVLFHLYAGSGSSLIVSTQHVFEQHELRHGYLSLVRARNVAESIHAYLKQQTSVATKREKEFSLASMEVLKRVAARDRPFMLECYQIKKGRVVYRTAVREKKHARRVTKFIKHFHTQHAHTRPRPMIPALLPPHILSMVQSPHDPFPLFARIEDRPSLELHRCIHLSLDYWKVDSTESPTRMRRMIKKNLHGSSHRAASLNAATGKTAMMAPQAMDLAQAIRTAVVVKDTTNTEKQSVDTDGTDSTAHPSAPPTPSSSASSSKDMLDGLGRDDDDDAEDEVADDDDEGLDEDDDDQRTSTGSGNKKRGSSSSSNKYLLVRDCVMITPERKYRGSMKIAQTHLIFVGTEMLKPEACAPPPPMMGVGAHTTPSSPTAAAAADPNSASTPTAAAAAAAGGAVPSSTKSMKRTKPKEKFLRWPLKSIRMVMPRLYLLRESALEFFLNNFRNYFFNFTPVDEETLAISWQNAQGFSANDQPTSSSSSSGSSSVSPSSSKPSTSSLPKRLRSGRDQRNEVYKLLVNLLPEMQFELSPSRRLARSGVTKKWQRGELSNFDYLQHLNTIAGRSYNDINQYPVFPWILTDYKSSTLDLTDPSIYRDLSKPIGALNEDRYEIYAERYQTFDDPLIPGFMYGSHYSSAGIALYYLLRIEPFTKLAIALQGNHFDLPDRMFDSIAGSWDLSLNNVGDVKELIPEFFYFPEFLKNLNGLDLGTKQDKQKLGDVQLPPWAQGSAEEFIRIHRAALESEYVSAHLHEWIDLIFGYKQRGKVAVEAQNVFFYLTYAGAVDIDAIDNPALRKATEDQIAHFGQTPAQLLTTPHPPRFSAAERAKYATGLITLPATLNPTYSSQLIHYYQHVLQPETKERRASDKRAATKAKLLASKTSPILRPSATNQADSTPPTLDLLSLGPLSSPSPSASASSPSTTRPISGQTFESARSSIVAQVPSTLVFAHNHCVISITDRFAVQTHNLAAFMAQHPFIMPQPDEPRRKTKKDTHTLQEESVAEGQEGSVDGGARSTEETTRTSLSEETDEEEPSTLNNNSQSGRSAHFESDDLVESVGHVHPSTSAVLSNAGNVLLSTVSQAPTVLRKQLISMLPAQRIPPAVHSSHVVQPMCQHWFMDPAEKRRMTTTNNQITSSGVRSRTPSHPSSSPRTSLSSPSSPSSSSSSSDSALIHRTVSAVSMNAQFLFSGGYFDGSLKCHSILHFRAEEPHDAHHHSSSSAASAVVGGVTSPFHHRPPTSPTLLVHNDATPTSNATGSLNRPVIQTRRLMDCKPLSSVTAHHAPITALNLAHNQCMLLSGDLRGSVCIWRVFTDRHERNRPPLASAPFASFSLHEGPVVEIASNSYIGVAVSLGRDLEDTRGCELSILSIRGVHARFLRSQLAMDPRTDWQKVCLTANANIIISGSQAGRPMMWSYGLNGTLLTTLELDEVINVLYATPPKSYGHEGFVVTGGRKGVIVFRHPHNLAPVQSFFTDDRYPQSIAHEPVAGNGNGRGSGPKASGDAALAAASTSSKSADVPDLWSGEMDETGGKSENVDQKTASSPKPGTSRSPSPTAASSSPEASVHDDPLIASIVQDCSIDIRMGIAALDLSPSQQHLVAAVYPSPFPPSPEAMNEDDANPNPTAASNVPPHFMHARLLLFPLPHSSTDSTLLGFYLSVGLSALDSVREALANRVQDTRDRSGLELARLGEKWSGATQQISNVATTAKSKIVSAFSGLFGGSKRASMSTAQAPNNQNKGSTSSSSSGTTNSIQ